MVFVGDPAVGKTCLLSSLICGQIPGEYQPTVWDKRAAEYQSRPLTFVDTGGSQSVDRLRSTAYYHTPETAVIYLVCFSINDRKSFANVSEQVNGIPIFRISLAIQFPVLSQRYFQP